MKPVCVSCGKQMQVKKNGVVAVEMAQKMGFIEQQPYRLWNADLYECSKCNREVVAGFGVVPAAYSIDPKFEDLLMNAQAEDNLILFTT
jgi:DNA-directed RNA polymerase subunit RPC12/RpoP